MHKVQPDKFDWIEFKQPTGWPEGRSPWMGVVTAKGRKPGVKQGSSVFGYNSVIEATSLPVHTIH